MKRTVMILLLALAAGMAAQAQVVIGLKGGLSSSHVDVKNVKNTLSQFKDKENITGYHLGVFTRFKAGLLVIQPEGVLSSSGGKIVFIQNQDGIEVASTETFRFNRLDVPVLVGLSVLNVLRLQAGPVASVLMEGKFAGQHIDDYLDKTDLGWQAGLGLDIGRLSADVRYERVKREYTRQPTSFEVGNEQVILSLGFKIFGK